MARFNDEAFREKVRDILKGFGKEYGRIGAELSSSIIKKINSGESVLKAVSEALSETAFFDSNKDAITNAIYLSACAGYGILPSIVASKSKNNIKKKLLSDSWAPDKMNLSSRIHKANTTMRTNIIDIISASMRNVDSIKSMAMELYDGYNSGKGVINKAELPDYLRRIELLARQSLNGDVLAMQEITKAIQSVKTNVENINAKALKAAYTDLLRVSDKVSEKALNRAVKTAIEEKTRYYSERIARTESARAWFEGIIAENANDDDVWGYRWVLSSRHALVPFDQCDVCANADVGYGPGVYPKNKIPSIPRHPHCMCMISPVFHWEVANKGDKFNPNKAREYIDSLSDVEKQSLFGRDGVNLYEKGFDWQKLLIGWNGFNEPVSRLNKADFELILNTNNGKIEEIREFILSDDQPKNIDKGKQDKHIEGTNNYKQKAEGLTSIGQYGPSRVYLSLIEIQNLINEFAGTGSIKIRKNGEWDRTETIYHNDKIVGSVVNNLNGKEIETTTFKVHYSKKGIHIVPHYPRKER